MNVVVNFSPYFEGLQQHTLVSFFAAGCRDYFVPTGPSARRMELPASPTVKRAAAHGTSRRIPDEYIVVFDNSVSDVRGRARVLGEISGATVHFTFENAIH